MSEAMVSRRGDGGGKSVFVVNNTLNSNFSISASIVQLEPFTGRDERTQMFSWTLPITKYKVLSCNLSYQLRSGIPVVNALLYPNEQIVYEYNGTQGHIKLTLNLIESDGYAALRCLVENLGDTWQTLYTSNKKW